MPRIALKSLVVVAVVTLVPALALANLGGPTSGNSGDPVFNRTCANCHRGSPLNVPPVRLDLVAPVSRFVPGSVIPVTVALRGTLQSPRNGFQASAWKEKPSGFGDLLYGWTAPDTKATRSISGHHVTHSTGGNLQSAWTLYFTAPSSATTFTIFAAANDANNDGKNTGDRVYTAKRTLSPGTVPLSLGALPKTGATVALDLDVPGAGGKPYVLGASLGDQGVTLGGKAIPLAPDALLFMSVTGLVPTVFGDYVGTLDKAGRAQAKLSIPAAPGLVGVTVHHAFVVLDSTAPGGVGAVSNSLPIRVY